MARHRPPESWPPRRASTCCDGTCRQGRDCPLVVSRIPPAPPVKGWRRLVPLIVGWGALAASIVLVYLAPQ